MAPQFNRRIPSPDVPAGLFQLFPNHRTAAFTLVELLVVIAITALLAGLLLPALARSKARAHAIVCLNNNRQLTFAWTLYSGDYNDRLVYNRGGNLDLDSRSSAPAGKPNWVNNVMDWLLTPDNTNTAFVATSLLGPFAGYSVPIYKCPADRALSDKQKTAGWSSRVRSVSMNAMVGDPGDLLISGANVNNPGYRQFLKDTEILNPSGIFVFLDEHPDSIGDGYFFDKWPDKSPNNGTNAAEIEWYDLPGSYHNGGASFSFADGHTEIHHWRNGSTCPPSVYEGVILPLEIDTDETTDLYWVLKRMSIQAGK